MANSRFSEKKWKYLSIGLMAVLAVALGGVTSPFQSAAAANTQQQFRTEVRVDCPFLPAGASGTTAFTLLKGGQPIGSATLGCNQVSFITTAAKPLEWKMSMTMKDSNGGVIATKDVSGRDFPASSSLQGQSYMFAYIRVPVRQ